MKAERLKRQESGEAADMAYVRQTLRLVQGTLERHGCPAAWPLGRNKGTMDEPDLLQLALCIDYIAQCRAGIDAAAAKPAWDRLRLQEAGRMQKALEEAERITVRMLISLFHEEASEGQKEK
ncbi:hypothetical protein KQI82_10785 [Oscillibacter sp. MSJ-2]|uniref:Uncharacterized protein n=1 Tax=Dysosmobacter acutus TaxID=2841504 RepID=A0ABS6FAS6_9FIRM|nr:hypothetical protein [Dysosmobacter acutus]MBU5627393.1 hypothetical protein [Dysosmobacter acutus]